MADKKKPAVSKMTDRRMTDRDTTKNPKVQEMVRAGGVRPGAAASTQVISTHQQLANFEAAIKLFHARKFKEAHDLFALAAKGPERDVAHRARLHATMCEQRLQQTTISLRTAEEYYNYGIALLNTRRIDDARQHLEKALELAPGADHIFYALAAAQALAGDAAGAHDHLKRAIELEPKNRLMARQDADFSSIAGQALFQALLYPEKKSW